MFDIKEMVNSSVQTHDFENMRLLSELFPMYKDLFEKQLQYIYRSTVLFHTYKVRLNALEGKAPSGNLEILRINFQILQETGVFVKNTTTAHLNVFKEGFTSLKEAEQAVAAANIAVENIDRWSNNVDVIFSLIEQMESMYGNK